LERLVEKEAFEFYYSQGSERSYMSTARRFNVAKKTIERWAKKNNWQERIVLRDQENAKKLEERTDKSIVDQKAELLTVAKFAIFGKGQFAERLRKGEIKAESIRDFDILVSKMLLLLGEVTERGETKHGISEQLQQLGTDPEFLRALQQASERGQTYSEGDGEA